MPTADPAPVSDLLAAEPVRASLAKVAWRHPDLQVSYDRVTIALSTHDVGGITEKHFALAERIGSVLMWRPGSAPGAVLSGTPDDAALRYIVYD